MAPNGAAIRSHRAPDAKLEAIVAGRPRINKGYTRAGQKLRRIGRDLAVRYDLPGSVDDPTVGRIAFQMEIRADRKDRGYPLAFKRLAVLCTQKDRPAFGIRLQFGKRPMGEDEVFATRGYMAEAMSAGCAVPVLERAALGRLTICIGSARTQGADQIAVHRIVIQFHPDLRFRLPDKNGPRGASRATRSLRIAR